VAPSDNSAVSGSALAAAIAATLPPWFRVAGETGEPSRIDPSWTFEGTVDDGSGPSRLYVAVTPAATMVETNPCTDPDFRQGGSCILRPGPGGTTLAIRGPVDANGTRTIVVALSHPDGSGAIAEASNFRIPDLRGPLVGGAPRPTMTVVRADPPLSLEQLAAVVVAADREIRACLAAGCR
jgi:hypothetical protein